MAPKVEMTCYNRALGFLARRSHFRAELEAKLRQRSYPADEIETTLERLVEKGFVDDFETARQFVANRTSKGMGKRRLRAELVKRRVPEAAIDEALAEVDTQAERALVREETERWIARGGGDPMALARRLDRRGFPSEAIREALSEAREAMARQAEEAAEES